MPSARVGCDGEIALGYAWVHPYKIASIRVQILDRIELTGNYRIFSGIDDPNFGHLGFGELTDKGANIKLALLFPEDSDYTLPGLAIGWQDFTGTQRFDAQYIVATQIIKALNLEASIGYGTKRINGIFGGVSWMPFFNVDHPWLQNLALVGEYDGNDYKNPKREPHPEGREFKTYWNYGLKYRFFDFCDFSASRVRGTEYAFSVSGFYNFGYSKGLLPKVDDAPPYVNPQNTEPLGYLRSEKLLAAELAFAFRKQGIEILSIDLSYGSSGEKKLYLKILNEKYRNQCDLRERLSRLLSSLLPCNIEEVIVSVSADGFESHELHFCGAFLQKFQEKLMGPYEIDLLTGISEVFHPLCQEPLFRHKPDLINLQVLPKTHTVFGNSKGKLKYTVGAEFGAFGYILDDLFYSLRFGYRFVTTEDGILDFDILNPSQLLNVQSDASRYYQKSGLTLDEAYFQKNWNLGCGFFAQIAAGYFNPLFAGSGIELLYYPVNSPFAIGLEGALIRKRNFNFMGMKDKVRQFVGYKPTFHRYRGSQGFLNLYYDFCPLSLDFKISIGKFLANDVGARFEMWRYFPSGFRFGVWYSVTNGRDQINGATYYDKGIAITMPLDMIYSYSSVSYWNYSVNAWLRDVACSTLAGRSLFDLISQQRQ